MKYRFHLICPECGKDSETIAAYRIPQPRVNCGDCLMGRVEIVELKIVKVEEIK
jgi:uncharacterized Zn finger protein